MQKGTDVEFKSLLTETEYNKLLDFFVNAKSDFQTNHYFDTRRFSLKALNSSLRVRQRETYELTFKRKKGYNTDLKSVPITEDEFNTLKFLFNFEGNNKNYLYFYDETKDNTSLYRFLGQDIVEILLRKSDCWILFTNTNIN